MQGSWAKLILQQEGQDKGCWRSTDEALTLQPGCPHWPATGTVSSHPRSPLSGSGEASARGSVMPRDVRSWAAATRGSWYSSTGAEWAFSCWPWWTSVNKVVWPAPHLKHVIHNYSPGIPPWLTKKQPTSCAIHPTAAPAPPLKPSQVGYGEKKRISLTPQG